MQKQQQELTIELLKPIINFCVNRGLKHQELEELLKRSYIAVAKESLLQSGREANVSSISALTGIHRRFITQIADTKSDATIEKINLLTKIINEWKKLSKNKKLPKLSYEGVDNEFTKLVASISKDLNAYTVLGELVRSNLVKKTPSGLQLIQNQYIPSKKDIQQSLLLLSRDLNLLIKAVEENIYGNSHIKNLHLTAEYDNIPDEYVDIIRNEILKRGSQFQENINEYLQQFDRDQNKNLQGTGRSKVSVGTFGYTSTEILPTNDNYKILKRRGRKGKTI